MCFFCKKEKVTGFSWVKFLDSKHIIRVQSNIIIFDGKSWINLLNPSKSLTENPPNPLPKIREEVLTFDSD